MNYCRCGADMEDTHFQYCPFPFDNERVDAPHMIDAWELNYAANIQTNWKAIAAYYGSPLYFEVEREKGHPTHEKRERYEHQFGTLIDTQTGHEAGYKGPI